MEIYISIVEDNNDSCNFIFLQVLDSGNRMKEFHVEIKETGDPEVDLNSLRT